MARELPIHNGRMTTDLDANGFKIKNLPPGSGFTQAQADWNQSDATAPDFIKNKPTIPAAVTVDPTLAVEGAAADAEAVGDALAGKVGCDAVKLRQDFGEDVDALFSDRLLVGSTRYDTHGTLMFAGDGSVFARDTVKVAVDDADPFDVALAIEPEFNVNGRGEFSFVSPSISVAPGPFATVGSVPLYLGFLVDGTGKSTPFVADDPSVSDPEDAFAVAPENAPYTSMDFDFTVDGHRVRMWVDESASCVMTLDARVRMFLGIPEGYSAANKADLPYALVTPGEWEFSGSGAYDINGPKEYGGEWFYTTGVYVSNKFNSESDAASALTLSFSDPSDPSDNFTATRASLPGHLCDRAGNRVVVSGDTTLTLPAAVAGKLRDFLVRLEISGSTVPTITFAAPTGETITYETDSDEFPVPDEVGNWSYSFTENCVAHTFAVSLKKVNTVAAPQAQGGS